MEQKSFFAPSRLFFWLTMVIMFGVALAIRVYDITDLPLDFHPTRQLFSAIKARGMYYETLTDAPAWQRDFAIKQWKSKVTIEPEFQERLAAYIYTYTGEQMWIPRLFSSIFWLVGGIFVFLLARELTSVDGGVLAVAFYYFVPYGISASRSFQPDPLMVALIIAFWWLAYRWADTHFPDGKETAGSVNEGWKWAILAGLIGGLAILIKFVAAFFVIGGAIGILFGCFKLREMIRNPQVWVIGLLGVLPGAGWILYGKIVLGLFGKDLSGRFIPGLLSEIAFYLRWEAQAEVVTSNIAIMLGLIGVFILRRKIVRGLLYGIWMSYLLFGLLFNYHISTHDYYSLPLIAIVALSLAPLGSWFFDRIRKTGSGWVRAAVFVTLIYGVFSTVWNVRNEMKTENYRPQISNWIEIQDVIGVNSSVVALTEDYGNRLVYWGWRKAVLWPTSGDLNQAQARGNQPDTDELFSELATKKDLFLITDLDDLKRQSNLQRLLAGYHKLVQEDGYLIYDLRQPLEFQP